MAGFRPQIQNPCQRKSRDYTTLLILREQIRLEIFLDIDNASKQDYTQIPTSVKWALVYDMTVTKSATETGLDSIARLVQQYSYRTWVIYRVVDVYILGGKG